MATADVVTTDRWDRIAPRYDEGVGNTASIGVIALATDRIGVWDLERFLDPVAGLAVFSTRVPMAESATPETLAAMGGHLADAARLIVPGSRLDVVAFSCTSGTVAIGADKVRAAIEGARPGVAVTTPIEAAAAGLETLGARRIALVTPYLIRTAELVAGYFEAAGIDIGALATFDLGGDPDMNRVAPDAIAAAAADTVARAEKVDAVFVSCTGLRTSPVVGRMEQELGLPVVTSNQALAWRSLRLAGIQAPVSGRGRLFEL